uniref:HTH_48 domain-containing protein n=1 Tax=Macrostomum lignano TaxID=282301 RepID=A0A1I8IN35_9PLAT
TSKQFSQAKSRRLTRSPTTSQSSCNRRLSARVVGAASLALISLPCSANTPIRSRPPGTAAAPATASALAESPSIGVLQFASSGSSSGGHLSTRGCCRSFSQRFLATSIRCGISSSGKHGAANGLTDAAPLANVGQNADKTAAFDQLLRHGGSGAEFRRRLHSRKGIDKPPPPLSKRCGISQRSIDSFGQRPQQPVAQQLNVPTASRSCYGINKAHVTKPVISIDNLVIRIDTAAARRAGGHQPSLIGGANQQAARRRVHFTVVPETSHRHLLVVKVHAHSRAGGGQIVGSALNQCDKVGVQAGRPESGQVGLECHSGVVWTAVGCLHLQQACRNSRPVWPLRVSTENSLLNTLASFAPNPFRPPVVALTESSKLLEARHVPAVRIVRVYSNWDAAAVVPDFHCASRRVHGDANVLSAGRISLPVIRRVHNNLVTDPVQAGRVAQLTLGHPIAAAVRPQCPGQLFGRLDRTNRHAIFTLWSSGTKLADIHRQLCTAHGDHAVSKMTVSRWVGEFQAGRTDVSDMPRSGRPAIRDSSSLTDRILDLIDEDCCQSIRKMADRLDCPKSTVHECLQKMNHVKLSARWVPQLLTEVMKLDRQQKCVNNLELVNQHGGWEAFRELIVTGDETWSMVWTIRGSDPPMKARRDRHSNKVMLTLFFDCNGPLTIEFLEPNLTINADRLQQLQLPGRPGPVVVVCRLLLSGRGSSIAAPSQVVVGDVACGAVLAVGLIVVRHGRGCGGCLCGRALRLLRLLQLLQLLRMLRMMRLIVMMKRLRLMKHSLQTRLLLLLLLLLPGAVFLLLLLPLLCPAILEPHLNSGLRLIRSATSSRMKMSGYLVLPNSSSRICSWALVKVHIHSNSLQLTGESRVVEYLVMRTRVAAESDASQAAHQREGGCLLGGGCCGGGRGASSSRRVVELGDRRADQIQVSFHLNCSQPGSNEDLDVITDSLLSVKCGASAETNTSNATLTTRVIYNFHSTERYCINSQASTNASTGTLQLPLFANLSAIATRLANLTFVTCDYRLPYRPGYSILLNIQHNLGYEDIDFYCHAKKPDRRFNPHLVLVSVLVLATERDPEHPRMWVRRELQLCHGHHVGSLATRSKLLIDGSVSISQLVLNTHRDDAEAADTAWPPLDASGNGTLHQELQFSITFFHVPACPELSCQTQNETGLPSSCELPQAASGDDAVGTVPCQLLIPTADSNTREALLKQSEAWLIRLRVSNFVLSCPCHGCETLYDWLPMYMTVSHRQPAGRNSAMSDKIIICGDYSNSSKVVYLPFTQTQQEIEISYTLSDLSPRVEVDFSSATLGPLPALLLQLVLDSGQGLKSRLVTATHVATILLSLVLLSCIAVKHRDSLRQRLVAAVLRTRPQDAVLMGEQSGSMMPLSLEQIRFKARSRMNATPPAESGAPASASRQSTKRPVACSVSSSTSCTGSGQYDSVRMMWSASWSRRRRSRGRLDGPSRRGDTKPPDLEGGAQQVSVRRVNLLLERLRQRPGLDHRMEKRRPLAVRTKGSPGKPAATPQILADAGNQTAEVDEVARKLCRLSISASAPNRSLDV